MVEPNHQIKYWPEAAREPLLQATFLSNERSLAAWQSWKNQIDMNDYPGFGSFRLLPALYRNVKIMGVDDPLLQRLKGIARKGWYQNQRFLRSIAAPLEALLQANLDVMLLHNPAMALRQSDYALDSETTLSLLVHPEKAAAAIAQLQALGWRSASGLPETRIEPYVASGFMHRFEDTTSRKILLHWHFLPLAANIQVDKVVWAEAVPERVNNIPVYIPSPADHILHICTQNSSLAEPSLFLRAVDVMLVVDSAPKVVDWERLLYQAEQHQLLLPVKQVMGYLQQILDGPLPSSLWRRLQALPVSKFERMEYVLTVRNKPVWWRQAWQVWFYYRRRNRCQSWLPTLTAFPRHLQHLWRLGSLREVVKRISRQTYSIGTERLRQSS